ncbi:uncharacterized protein YcfJ [Bradyrhizobium sp. USDA 4341]
MKQVVKRCADVILSGRKARPKEFHWSIYGIAAGAFVGLFLGGVGIAALGAAIGVSAWIITAIAGGMIGNRIGIGKDKATLAKVKK